MNWELQLADAMPPEEMFLVLSARKARRLAIEGRYGAALKRLWKLLLASARRGSGRPRAFVKLHMGHVYRCWMIEVAFKFFREARELSREAGFVHGEMVAETSLGLLYLDWEEPGAALRRFERGLALSERAGGPWWRRDVLVEIIGCLEALGETRRAEVERSRLGRWDAELLEELWGDPGVGGSALPDHEEQGADTGTTRGDGPCRS